MMRGWETWTKEDNLGYKTITHRSDSKGCRRWVFVLNGKKTFFGKDGSKDDKVINYSSVIVAHSLFVCI